ncbi:hypothetical protein [Mucilaginibacter dorajii]|uniref:Uncharacterized protein n=1 Tax=Mucilaginibacter dorajii TaxID=692994 RepID=A0ABP7QWA7_9SPHI|nr:hypothetical protein [Mucilaginibacter dorajii]MCS3735666.1 N-methylhydantoinase B/oxoprolinase/acetone carboxylase alpha subunit [Mucilaginibacter dorajii]
MKSKANKKTVKQNTLREDILKSMVASFKIEGIHISDQKASAALKRVELSLGK